MSGLSLNNKLWDMSDIVRITDEYHDSARTKCLKRGTRVPDPFAKAQRYRERAVECRRLAAMSVSPKTRADYEALAEQYEDIAKLELKLADSEKPVSTE